MLQLYKDFVYNKHKKCCNSINQNCVKKFQNFHFSYIKATTFNKMIKIHLLFLKFNLVTLSSFYFYKDMLTVLVYIL